MSQSTPSLPIRRGSARASLVALGLALTQRDLLRPLHARVHLPQKRVRYAPTEKLTDLFIGLLAGIKGTVEINTVLRPDPAVQAAFGRRGCAEQSVLQDTLDAATPDNVRQLEQAVTEIYQTHSRGYRHDYAQHWQLLDVDLTGLPCGSKAAFASLGYFAGSRARRGRQLGRVLASHYDEVVVDRLFEGKTVLATALVPLVEAAEETLALDEAKRTRTVIRVDAGGGSVGDLNWLLERGYQVLAKDYSSQRAARLAANVETWYDDPKVPGRQVGWVTLPASEYARPVQRLAVRCRRRNETWAVGVLITTLTPAAAQALLGVPAAAGEAAAALAYVHLYDQRGGGVETAIKGDKQGLGLPKRNKKRWAAQQLLVQLNTLAHNVLIWAREWLAPWQPRLRAYGIHRLRRDVWGISGSIELDRHGHVTGIILNQANRLAHHCLPAFQSLLAATDLVITLGET